MSNYSKLKVGLFWNVFGTVGSKGFIMLAAILTSRILGAKLNGQFGMINNTVVMFSTFAALGLGTTATRFIAEYKSKNKKKCGNIIALTSGFAMFSSLVMGITLLLLSGWLAKNTLNNVDLTLGLRISTILLVFTTLNTVQTSILAGFESFKFIAKLSILQGFISLPLFVLTTYMFKVNGLIVGYSIVSIMVFILAKAQIKKVMDDSDIKMSYNECLNEKRILFTFSVPSMLSNLMVGPITWIGNTMLISLTNGYASLGVFNAANQWRMALTLLPTAIGNVILPYIISNNQKDEKLEHINILLSWFLVCAFSSVIILLVNIITNFYGTSYSFDELRSSIIITTMVCCLLSFKEGISRNLIKYNFIWFGFFSNLLWGGVFLLSIYFLRYLGSVGMTLAYLFSYFVTTLIFIPFYIKRGIVKKDYFVSKHVLLVWISLCIEVYVSLAMPNNSFLNLFCSLIVLLCLYLNIKRFFNIKLRINGICK